MRKTKTENANFGFIATDDQAEGSRAQQELREKNLHHESEETKDATTDEESKTGEPSNRPV